MNSTSYPLSQAESLAISGILSAGHEESAESFAPMESAPVWEPLSRAALCGNVPRTPRNYYGQDEDEGESLDEGEEDELPRERDVMPSRSSRRAVARELKAMGYAWND